MIAHLSAAGVAAVVGSRFMLRPIALFGEGALRSLDVDPLRTGPSGWLETLRAQLRRDPVSVALRVASHGSRLLDQVATELTGIAETGGRFLTAAGERRPGQLGEAADEAGVPSLAAALERLRGAGEGRSAELLAVR